MPGTVVSGLVVCGLVASGLVAFGLVVSGLVASGLVASGLVEWALVESGKATGVVVVPGEVGEGTDVVLAGVAELVEEQSP